MVAKVASIREHRRDFVIMSIAPFVRSRKSPGPLLASSSAKRRSDRHDDEIPAVLADAGGGRDHGAASVETGPGSSGGPDLQRADGLSRRFNWPSTTPGCSTIMVAPGAYARERDHSQGPDAQRCSGGDPAPGRVGAESIVSGARSLGNNPVFTIAASNVAIEGLRSGSRHTGAAIGITVKNGRQLVL